MNIRTQKISIIEVLIVVAIISILATIAGAKIGDMRYRAQKVDNTLKVHSIDMALRQYYKDFGDWPRPSSNNQSGNVDNRADMRRPFSEIEAVLLGDNSKGISYLNGPITSSWITGNPKGNGNNAYENHEFMIALDYDGDGVISKNVFSNKTDPAVTEDLVLDGGAALWLHTPADWDTDISNWADSELKSTDTTNGNSGNNENSGNGGNPNK